MCLSIGHETSPRRLVDKVSRPAFDSPESDEGHFLYVSHKHKNIPQLKSGIFLCLWTLGESNSSPPECKTGALPYELRALIIFFYTSELFSHTTRQFCKNRRQYNFSVYHLVPYELRALIIFFLHIRTLLSYHTPVLQKPSAVQFLGVPPRAI